MESNNERYYYKEKANVYLKFPYDDGIIKDIKTIPNRVWNNYNKYWIIEETLRNRRAIAYLISKYEFSLKNFKTKSIEEFPKVDMSKIEDSLYNYMEDFDELELKYQPRDYQKLAVNYALNKKRFINADDVGVGKTAETVFAAELGCLFPFLIICPNCVKYHWQSFFKETNPDRNISVIETGKKEKDNNWGADVIIINYDILGSKEVKKDGDIIISTKIVPRFEELLTTKFEGIAIDEIHYIKNSKSIRSKMCKKIAKGCEYVWGLSGTLVLNRPSELINPLTTIGRFNDLFGDWNTFVHTYCDAKRTRFGLDTSGSSNIDRLNNKLRNSCYIRREKSEVLDFIPDRQSTVIQIELSNRDKYDRAENNFLEYIQKTYTKEKADAAANAEQLVLRSELTKLCVDGKLKMLEDWLKNFTENTNEKMLVFGVHREPLEKLSKKFKSQFIRGGISAENKQKIVKDFKGGSSQFLFGNIKAMGTGLDGLQDSIKNVSFIELPYTDGELQQAIGRVDRSGQKSEKIDIFYFLGKDAIDEYVMEILDEKKMIADCINKGVPMDEIKGFNQLFIEKMSNKHK